MPTKNENPNIYMVDENGGLHELNRIENLDIEMDFDSPQDFSSALKTFGIQSEALIKEYKSYVQAFAPNNWLKMHGYPMRRRFGK